MSNSWDIYATRVKKLLKERGMTQGELAEMVGTSQETMSRYLKARRIPNASVILSTAKILKVSCDYLVGLSSIQTSKPADDLYKQGFIDGRTQMRKELLTAIKETVGAEEWKNI